MKVPVRPAHSLHLEEAGALIDVSHRLDRCHLIRMACTMNLFNLHLALPASRSHPPSGRK